MATFSTHILSSLDGTHLSDVLVCLVEIQVTGKRKIIFQKKTDSGGRMSTQFSPNIAENFEYEFTVSPPVSFNHNQKTDKIKNYTRISSLSVRIKIENADANYHIPFILSPYGFSSWVSR